MIRVPSSDGIEVAVHDLAAHDSAVHRSGGVGAPLLLSHATGFHGHCYLPMAEALAGRFHPYALDYRGHGLTPRPDDWQVDWDRYGDDATAAALAVAPDGGLVAFGHSMGGAALLMAAAREPDLFDLIVAFEPIVLPPPDLSVPRPESVLVVGARRRRRSFESYEQAYENYAAKPPLSSFTPAALRAYVEHGFEPSPDGVTLRCDPEHEARTFEQGGMHRTWELLPDISTRVVVVAGAIDGLGPAAMAAPVAAQLPNATYLQLDHLDHFGPMTHPDELADLVATSVVTS